MSSDMEFTDAKGRQWSCRISFQAAKALQANCAVQLDNADAMSKALSDPVQVVLMIAEACREQWAKATIERIDGQRTIVEPMSCNDFIELVLATPEVSAAAAGAFQAALADWYARLGKPAFGKLLEATAAAQRRADAKALEKISDSRVGSILDKVVDAAISQIDRAIDKAGQTANAT